MSDSEARVEVVNVRLPEEAHVVYARFGVVLYLREDGSQGYAVSALGDAPMTTYLGMTVAAQHQIMKWGDGE